ncbi:hypothetical protein [Neptuniibacter sp. QD37_11]|uniref:hypothetical protein n=1 Tax=Neptuniibacter sp. QD37_11 TaxID=3398209 RepID=UPI0039F57075
MTQYHYQCQHCLCTTNMWEDDDGLNDFYGGAIDDCGCQSEDEFEDDWDDD